MFAESDALNEIEVGIQNFLWSMTAENTDEQRNDTFHDKCIALGREPQLIVAVVGLQPHPTLTAVDEVAFGLVFLIQRLLFITQVDEQLIAVHPVIEF